MWTSPAAKVHHPFFSIPPATHNTSPNDTGSEKVPTVNTDGHLGYITALKMILVYRIESKPPPGTMGCQLQPGTVAKVTGLLPYGKAGCMEHSCSAHTCHTSGQKWPGHRLLSWGTGEARGEGWGVSTVTNLLTLLLEGQVKGIHSTFESFKVPAYQDKQRYPPKLWYLFSFSKRQYFHISSLGSWLRMWLTKPISTV